MIEQLTALLTESRQRGFLGPGPVEDHLDHARAFAVAASDAPASAVDLGAGGGLPGLVLAALVWPTTRWTFVDAQRKRTAFLEEAVDALGLEARVTVRTERAEVLGREPEHRGVHDLVVARSFGAPPVTAECAAPLLRAGGRLIVSEPPASDLAVRWPAAGLAILGLSPATPIEAAAGAVHLAAMTCVEACDDRYPRRTGIPTKRPLF